LGKLERKYERELAVIGVQSPKYPAEGNFENLRHAVQRLDIHHAVVNDPDLRVWDAYAVRAWPTLVFLSPDGQVIGQHAGEAPLEALSRAMEGVIAEYERDGRLNRGHVDLQVEAFSRPLDQLAFPGKVLSAGERVFIADSGHHRIVVADVRGRVLQVIGSGRAGLQDGDRDAASFNRPQGMALDQRGVLYVADSENHAIRKVDLDSGRVTTVAGTGEQATRVQRRGPARETSLSSPWDLAVEGESLYIAMAGTHQVWRMDLTGDEVEVWAGTGHEDIRDGARLGAWLAQPMGLSSNGWELLVACAEAQAVRSVDLETGALETLVGRGLFVLGDQDGPTSQALLQHNQDVAAGDSAVYVADTYNNKIKVIDRGSADVRTVAGSGHAGLLDGPGANARFDEPTGLSLSGDTLYIADSNNHEIRTLDLQSGHVATLQLAGRGAGG
jgi:DNA-binding beta-propeller fold protein YncE